MASTRTLRSTPASPASASILGARVLAEFGDDPHRYADAKARKNYAGTSPITRASGTQEDRAGPLRPQPTPRRRRCTNGPSPRCAAHPAPAPTTTASAPAASATTPPCASSRNRLVGILHGCLKTRTLYDEHTAWAHHIHSRRLTPKNLGCLPRVGSARARRSWEMPLTANMLASCLGDPRW